MINKLAVTAATGAMIATTVLTATSPAHAAPVHERCSVATLRGAYAGNIMGTSNTGPFNLQSMTVFHGDGTATGIKVTLANRSEVTTFTANDTYTLAADCTGTLTAVRSTGVVAHYVIAVVDGGRKIDLLQTDPGSVANGAFDRVAG
ncbi:hypothetical protein [Streptomyces sp. HPF1205]|uniref:hypothetical protein n=1 Tax=Streptomyces sp. HPF1205 TaxID=2873262 RepID=UPI001CECB27B|nr:hypothetical protein [Streptomyces sp. HPF1205]